MTRFEKWSVLISSALAAITGVAYFWVKYAMVPTEPWAVINHPIQPWLLKSHIVLVPLLVFAVGMIATRHIWRHYRSGMVLGRKSGLMTALSVVPMVVSGYLIQGVTAPSLLSIVTWTHIGTSVLFTVGVAVHSVLLTRHLALKKRERSRTGVVVERRSAIRDRVAVQRRSFAANPSSEQFVQTARPARDLDQFGLTAQ